jgi:hypothetical protein
LGNSVFYNCTNLRSVILGNSIKSIGDALFQNCTTLTSITIPTSVISIGFASFYHCIGLINVTIPNSVKSIGDAAFYSCPSLTNVTIPDSIITIGNSAFYSCGGLTTVTIGNSVEIIGDNAFNTCSNLKTVTFYCSPLPFIGNFVFTGIGYPSTAYVQAHTNTQSIEQYFTFIYYLKEESPISNACFPAGTMIVTNQGDIPIEKINTSVHTIRNKKIVCIIKTINEDKHLVCFEKDSLAPNIPSDKTIISKCHKIFYKGKILKAIDFVGMFDNVYKITYRGEILYNVLMENYNKMLVNNLICETLHPKNYIAELYKDLQTMSPDQQKKIIKKFNEYMKEINFHQKKSINHKS